MTTLNRPTGLFLKFAGRLLGALAVTAALLSNALAAEARVVSSVSTLSYTFIEINRDGKSLWLAADVTQLKPGDLIRFDEGYVMMNFFSNDLQRTFANLTFVEKVSVLPVLPASAASK